MRMAKWLYIFIQSKRMAKLVNKIETVVFATQYMVVITSGVDSQPGGRSLDWLLNHSF